VPCSHEGLNLCHRDDASSKVTNPLDAEILASINYKGGHVRFQDWTIKPFESGAN
jgi:hypothetical protein